VREVTAMLGKWIRAWRRARHWRIASEAELRELLETDRRCSPVALRAPEAVPGFRTLLIPCAAAYASDYELRGVAP
jgi:hypothetical protein